MGGVVNVACSLCGELLDPDASSSAQKIEGWEQRGAARPSGARGGSDILDRRPLQEWAHVVCVKRERAGIASRQEAIV